MNLSYPGYHIILFLFFFFFPNKISVVPVLKMIKNTAVLKVFGFPCIMFKKLGNELCDRALKINSSLPLFALKSVCADVVLSQSWKTRQENILRNHLANFPDTKWDHLHLQNSQAPVIFVTFPDHIFSV